MASPYSRIRTN